MANIPKKTKDATEEALSAIQEALNVRAPETRTTASFDPAAESDTASPPAPPAADLFPQDAVQGGWPTGDTTPRRAANDDRAGIGQILQSLRHRPARGPYIAAAAASLIWVAGGLALTTLYGAEMRSVFATSGVGFAAMVAVAAAIVVPVIFFFALAHMFTRAQDMRLVVESMAEVAMRLAQPETSAREQIVSVGQAIRREVAAMGDGVERALARAAELEALVHNEVSALERAYNDNEVRIRDLLAELTNQRDTLVGQAEQVRNAIGSVHLGLSHEIAAVGDTVAERVNEVAQRVTRSLTEKGEHITLALGRAGDSMIDALSERGSTMLDRLETTGDRTTKAISSASEQLNASLDFKTDHIHDEFAELSSRLQQMMTSRLDQVSQGFTQKATAVIENMAVRSEEMTSTLSDTGARLTSELAGRVEDANKTLRNTGDSLLLDLSTRGNDVVARMEQTGSRVSDDIIARSNKVADTFRDSAETLAATIDKQTDGVRTMLSARLQAFDDVFSRDGVALSEKIARDSAALGDLIIRHLGE